MRALIVILCAALFGCQQAGHAEAPFYATVSGRSMLPYIKKHSLVFIGKFSYEDLEPGMVADRSGVLHALKTYDPKTQSWVMQGTYNARPDAWPLTRLNYVGVVPGLKVPLIFPDR